ncbi:MAG: DNA translocase FtsK 4TM domain-containing protein [Pseudomonadota bacterium]
MAFFTSSKSHDPLMERSTRAYIGKRGTQLIGVFTFLLGLVALGVLWTYNPNDPSPFNAVDRAPTNLLGGPGAALAELLTRFIGWAAWGIPATLIVWGARLMALRGEERVVTRLVLAPLAIAVGAIFASVHVPPPTWLPDTGLGGVFGDQALLGLFRLVPLDLPLAMLVLTLALALGTVVLGALALGVDVREARWLSAAFWRGLREVLAGIVALIALVWSGRGLLQRVKRPAPAEEDAPAAARVDPGFANRVARKVAEAETPLPEGPDSERLMARITAAVQARSEPAVTRVSEPLAEPDLPPLDEPPAAPSFDTPEQTLAPQPLPDDLHQPEDRPAKPIVAHPPRRAPQKSQRARAEEQPQLFKEPGEGFELPPLSLLASPVNIERSYLSDDALEANARLLETVLDDYGIRGEIVSVRPGPVVTMYELEPAPGLKASRVIGLADDIARSMSALAARVSTVPGRSIIGIELPNDHREKVLLREILSAKGYGDSSHSLPLALGKDIGGEPVVANLARMPHLLIAGTTGSGKSVAINTMILSLLYRLTPEECRMIMIDPKMLELSVYDGIPHLLSPVVTDPKKAVVALKWVVAEMEERYRKMSKMGVRNIDGYNSRVSDALAKGEAFTRTVQTGFDEDTGEPMFETEEFAPERMPFIVVIVDEMADLMMVAGKEIEACIQRLAQMARASGIHLIMATQRPSVDVITGTIKANFPTRISFQVTSKVDSRTILGEMGAEQLLGMGDMLHMAGGGRITRVHGPFVSDEEVEEIVNHLKSLGAPEYVAGVTDGPDEEAESDIDLVLGLGGNTGSDDALYDQAVGIVARDRKCSTSYIQRKLAIGYNKAARLVEQMEENGVVTPANKVGKRDILVPEV